MGTALIISYFLEISLLVALGVVVVIMTMRANKAKKACRIFRERPQHSLWMSLFEVSTEAPGNGKDYSQDALILFNEKIEEMEEEKSEDLKVFMRASGG